MKQPQNTKIQEMNKLWYSKLRNRQTLTLTACEYY